AGLVEDAEVRRVLVEHALRRRDGLVDQRLQLLQLRVRQLVEQPGGARVIAVEERDLRLERLDLGVVGGRLGQRRDEVARVVDALLLEGADGLYVVAETRPRDSRNGKKETGDGKQATGNRKCPDPAPDRFRFPVACFPSPVFFGAHFTSSS